MKKQLNDGFKMWANYVEAIDSYTKNDDAKYKEILINMAPPDSGFVEGNTYNIVINIIDTDLD